MLTNGFLMLDLHGKSNLYYRSQWQKKF